jgi:hypothetical protein
VQVLLLLVLLVLVIAAVVVLKKSGPHLGPAQHTLWPRLACGSPPHPRRTEAHEQHPPQVLFGLGACGEALGAEEGIGCAPGLLNSGRGSSCSSPHTTTTTSTGDAAIQVVCGQAPHDESRCGSGGRHGDGPQPRERQRGTAAATSTAIWGGGVS